MGCGRARAHLTSDFEAPNQEGWVCPLFSPTGLRRRTRRSWL